MCPRVYNFSAGPAVLPQKVLAEAAEAVRELPGLGISILEISHRSKAIDEVLAEAKMLLTELLGIPAGYSILFLQGGSSLQFSMVPMNLLRGSGRAADYILTGSWASKALAEAAADRRQRHASPGTASRTTHSHLPSQGELQVHARRGLRPHHGQRDDPGRRVHRPSRTPARVPLVCDASSNFLSRPVDVGRYGLIYACAQKNAGIAGVTVVIIRDELLERVPEDLPPMLDYKLQAENDSLYNTPPVFAIYVLLLVARWLKHDVGGLAKMARRNREKAKLLYDVLDAHPDFYRGHARPDSRSHDERHLAAAERRAGSGVPQAGQGDAAWSTQGASLASAASRASIYNAMPREGVAALRDLMLEFHKQHA